jgi:hypothetical protein
MTPEQVIMFLVATHGVENLEQHGYSVAGDFRQLRQRDPIRRNAGPIKLPQTGQTNQKSRPCRPPNPDRTTAIAGSNPHVSTEGKIE